MRAFKAFNKNMTCTLGKGSYQYQEGRTYREDKAQARSTGFHCVSFILDCYRYYEKSKDTIICPVEALGDIDEDGTDTKISCTVMKIGRRLTPERIVLEALLYLKEHPKFKDKNNIHQDKGKDNFFCIVRGRNPIAAGTKDTVLGLIEEDPKHNITCIAIYKVGCDGIRPGRYYNLEGKEVEDAQS